MPGPAVARTMSESPAAARRSVTTSASRSGKCACSCSRTARIPSGWVPKSSSRSRCGMVVSRNGRASRPWVPVPMTSALRLPGAASSRASSAETAGVRRAPIRPQSIIATGSPVASS
ncbi:hypothetical protein SGLAM104S_08618 [Streptomyces glaucescens]